MHRQRVVLAGAILGLSTLVISTGLVSASCFGPNEGAGTQYTGSTQAKAAVPMLTCSPFPARQLALP